MSCTEYAQHVRNQSLPGCNALGRAHKVRGGDAVIRAWDGHQDEPNEPCPEPRYDEANNPGGEQVVALSKRPLERDRRSETARCVRRRPPETPATQLQDCATGGPPTLEFGRDKT